MTHLTTTCVRAVPFVTFLVLLAGSVAAAAKADLPRALPPNTLPQDGRLNDWRTLDSYFPFTPVPSPEMWAKRAAQLRRQVMVSQGIWPMPTKTPLEAVVHGKIERDDYSVEKVYFQSYPGHYVTGNLYRPKGKPGNNGKFPVVLCPHGHWSNGRFHDHGEAGVRGQIAKGAERFEVSGRHPLQARQVGLARMGCIVFHYDMEGYADSVQFTDDKGNVQHRPGVRDAMNTKENWGLFSPQADLWLQNIMGLQTWNSVRALDFMATLPDADMTRVAVTGASGGGTQTFMLAAVDERVIVSIPAVMVSTAMQGGCTCENAPYLRINAGNIDLAAIPAPKPLELLAADDWTKEILAKGYPDLQALYAMLGKPDNVHADAFLHFEHNYNGVSRMAMYNWVNRHFGLGLPEPVLERDFQPLSIPEMSVWDAQHPRPTGDKVGAVHERALVKHMTDDSARIVDALIPKDPASLEEYRKVVGGAWDTIIGRRLEDAGANADVEFSLVDKQDKGQYLQMTGVVTRTPKPLQGMPGKAQTELLPWQLTEQLPMLFIHPPGDKWNGQVVIWLDEKGKAGLLGDDGKAPRSAVSKLVMAGYSVVGVDLLLQGEFRNDAQLLKDAPVKGYGNESDPWMKSSVYTYGYNPALFSRRVHDVLTVLHLARHDDEHKVQKIHLVGIGPVAGPIAAAALAQSSANVVDKAAIDTAGFRFASLDRVNHPMFVPGAARYHDLPGLLALSMPNKLWLGGEEAAPKPVAEAYKAGGREGAVVVSPLKGGDSSEAVAEWMQK